MQNVSEGKIAEFGENDANIILYKKIQFYSNSAIFFLKSALVLLLIVLWFCIIEFGRTRLVHRDSSVWEAVEVVLQQQWLDEVKKLWVVLCNMHP